MIQFFILAIMMFYFLDESRAACGTVSVDCGTHMIQIGGHRAKIDCGAPGRTKNGVGKIGGRHKGELIKDGVAIDNFPGMGQSGGGKVFHTVFWRRPPNPTGVDASRGCVRVDPNTLRILKGCKGSPLVIRNAKGGGRNPATTAGMQSGFQSPFHNPRPQTLDTRPKGFRWPIPFAWPPNQDQTVPQKGKGPKQQKRWVPPWMDTDSTR